MIDLGVINENTKEKFEIAKNMTEMGFSDEQISDILLIAESNSQGVKTDESLR
jgi:hypothetical protein